MIDHLKVREKDSDPDYRADMDRLLTVDDWRTAWGEPRETKRKRLGIPTNAPSWWEGEEEASQSFVQEMGVQLT